MSARSQAVGYFRYLVLLIIIALSTLLVVTNGSINGNFLLTSVMIVLFAFSNLLVVYVDRREEWLRFTQLMFVAMVFGSIGDFQMRVSLVNGVLFFTMGHLFYLLALRSLSPLLHRDDRPVFLKTVGVWVLCIICTLLLLVFTVFNPSELVLSYGVGMYGFLLATVLAFAISKSFEDFPTPFKLVLAFGFFFFLFSDWMIGIRHLQNPSFSSSMFVGITYIIGQVLIHLTSQFRE